MKRPVRLREHGRCVQFASQGGFHEVDDRLRRNSRIRARVSGCRAAAATGGDTARGAAAADRDQEGRGHRRGLHFPQWQSPIDVRRHEGRRDRDRPGRLWPPDRRAAVCRRDQEGHRQADQVSDLQPRPLRSHRRRQGVQGRRRTRGRPRKCHQAAQGAEGSAHRDAGRVGRQQEDHQARRHHAGAALSRAEPLRTRRW